MQRTIALFTVCCLAATLAVSCVNEADSSRLKTGDAIPSFTVDGPYGTFSSSEYNGRGGLLLFFASYCSTCHRALPAAEQIWGASDSGNLFAFAALSRQGVYDETEDAVARYWQETGFTMPYYLDFDGEVYYRFARETIPRICVIDKGGRIAYMSVGNGDITAEEIARELEKALGVEIDI
ncbi:MAG: TlpA family protein disulfide reductase [Rikenellaceae bacterium]|nr:TlpA family protein disulfide reductase [Rikenellaceae bacterium]